MSNTHVAEHKPYPIPDIGANASISEGNQTIVGNKTFTSPFSLASLTLSNTSNQLTLGSGHTIVINAPTAEQQARQAQQALEARQAQLAFDAEFQDDSDHEIFDDDVAQAIFDPEIPDIVPVPEMPEQQWTETPSEPLPDVDPNDCKVQTCCVCLDKPSCMIMIACAHLCVCEKCGPLLGKCPKCREPSKCTRVFM